MNKYKETFITWNKVAKVYQDKFMDLNQYDGTYDVFLNTLPKKDASVLEIGCGPGNITKYLLSKNNELQIKGIDIAENMIQLAKKNNPLADFEVMDCRFISNINEKYDAIMCGFCLPYLSQKDCTKFILDCKALLNDDGVFYLSFVEGDYNNSGFISGSSGDRAYFYYHDLNFLKKEFNNCGIEIIETYLIEYKKPDGSIELHTVLIISCV